MTPWNLITILFVLFCFFAGAQSAVNGIGWNVAIQAVGACLHIFFLYKSIKRHSKQCDMENPQLIGFGFVKGKYVYTNADDPQRDKPLMLIATSEWDGNMIAVRNGRTYLCHYDWKDESINDLVMESMETGALLPRYKIRERLWYVPKSLKTVIKNLTAE